MARLRLAWRQTLQAAVLTVKTRRAESGEGCPSQPLGPWLIDLRPAGNAAKCSSVLCMVARQDTRRWQRCGAMGVTVITLPAGLAQLADSFFGGDSSVEYNVGLAFKSLMFRLLSRRARPVMGVGKICGPAELGLQNNHQ